MDHLNALLAEGFADTHPNEATAVGVGAFLLVLFVIFLVILRRR